MIKCNVDRIADGDFSLFVYLYPMIESKRDNDRSIYEPDWENVLSP